MPQMIVEGRVGGIFGQRLAQQGNAPGGRAAGIGGHREIDEPQNAGW